MRLGIDLGGSKIEIIALDEQGQEQFRQRTATPKGDYAATLDAISGLVDDCEQALGVKGSLGIGIPGAQSMRSGLIKNANSTWLIGQDLQGDLQNRLARSVRLANDANCFALSEAMDGSAQGAKVVFGVIIGTGCGGGLVVNGLVVQGRNAIAGEWGHNPLPWYTDEDKRLSCYCGQIGCLETFVSGSGLERHYQQRHGENLSAQQLAILAEQGEPRAENLMNDYVVWLAKGLASVINLLDPEVIVLGGGLSNVAHLYQAVPAIWDQWIFSNEPTLTRLVPPMHGDSSGVRGAAWLNDLT
ncbi:MAG: ROK family protein [Thiotrichales bacterium]|nr:ROK family protein [Thiotrichales bacterium]